MPKKCSSYKSAKRSDPKLWKRIVSQVKSSDKGGPSGKWSARKSQLAVKKYKQRGGKYSGKKSPCNALTKWSKEDWNYIGGKGSDPKKHKGRYLPRAIRERLSPAQKRSENKRKGSKVGRHVSYGKPVRKLLHLIK